MKDKTFFYKQITSLLESSELDFSVVTDLVEIRKQKLAEVEDIVNRIREGRHSGKLIRTARDDAAQTFLFRAYDPVSGRLVVQKKDSWIDIIDPLSLIFGRYTFVKDEQSSQEH